MKNYMKRPVLTGVHRGELFFAVRGSISAYDKDGFGVPTLRKSVFIVLSDVAFTFRYPEGWVEADTRSTSVLNLYVMVLVDGQLRYLNIGDVRNGRSELIGTVTE